MWLRKFTYSLFSLRYGEILVDFYNVIRMNDFLGFLLIIGFFLFVVSVIKKVD